MLDVRDSGRCGIEFPQASLRPFCNNPCHGGFPGAGRAVKDHVRRASALHDPAQQAVSAQNMLLSDHVVQTLRANLVGKRFIAAVSHVSPAFYAKSCPRRRGSSFLSDVLDVRTAISLFLPRLPEQDSPSLRVPLRRFSCQIPVWHRSSGTESIPRPAFRRQN